jgi:hypothetical protein
LAHAFAIQYLGNVDRCRTEAEVSLADRESEDPLVALVYESENGVAVEYFGRAANNRVLPGLDEAIADAYAGLQRYVNRLGVAPPDGLSRAGLSLWLLMREDRTALGVRI